MKKTCFRKFLIIILVELFSWSTASNPHGPSLEELEEKKCPSNKPLLCIPYGACCSHSEFCHAGLCESCFHDYVLSSLQEWCRERGQYNLSLMRSNSCRFACHDRFTPQELAPIKILASVALPVTYEKTPPQSTDHGDVSIHNTIGVLTFVIVLILLFSKIIPKIWHRLRRNLKCKRPIIKRAAINEDRSFTKAPSKHYTTRSSSCDKQTTTDDTILPDPPHSNQNLSNAKQTDRMKTSPHTEPSKDLGEKTNAPDKSQLNSKLGECGIKIDCHANQKCTDWETKDHELGACGGQFDKLKVAGCDTDEVSCSSTPLLENERKDGGKAKNPTPENENRIGPTDISTSCTDLTTSAYFQQQGLTGINGYKLEKDSHEARSHIKRQQRMMNEVREIKQNDVSGTDLQRGRWYDVFQVHKHNSFLDLPAVESGRLPGIVNDVPNRVFMSGARSDSGDHNEDDLGTSGSSLGSFRPGVYDSYPDVELTRKTS